MSRDEKYMESSDTALKEAPHDDISYRVPRPRPDKWRVADVMSTDMVTIDKNMPFKQVARLLAEHDLSSAPVVTGGGHVLGMISEADVLRKEEQFFSRLGAGLPPHTHHQRKQAQAITAAELMNSPAITIHPDAPLGAAALLMNAHRIRRLPVVGPDKELMGMVSRHDLLSVFLRPDREVAVDVAAELAAALENRPMRVVVSVADGEVRLAGEMADRDTIREAVKIATRVDGVVAVHDHLTSARP